MKGMVLAMLLTGLCFGVTTVQAEEEVQQGADQGAASTEAFFGGVYCFGGGVTQDYRQVFTWLRKAAEQVVIHAQYNLGETDVTALADAQTLTSQYF